MRKHLVPLLAALLAAAATTSFALADQQAGHGRHDHPSAYAIGLWVETFGDHQENGNNDAQWLKVTVDPRSREVFSFQPQIVPGNRTAVPAA